MHVWGKWIQRHRWRGTKGLNSKRISRGEVIVPTYLPTRLLKAGSQSDHELPSDQRNKKLLKPSCR